MRNTTFFLKWVLVTAFASSLGWLLAARLPPWLVSELQFTGPVAVALPILGALLLLSSFQWLLIREASYSLWLIATISGFTIGFPLASLLAFGAVAVPETLGSVSPLPWLGRPARLLIMSTIGGLPGGFVSGALKRLAVRQGKLLLWIPVSMIAWGVGLATTNLTMYLFSSAIAIPSNLVQILFVGAAGGLVYGAIVGAYLAILVKGDES